MNLLGLSSNIAFLGTSLIIIIMTSIEGIKQLEGFLLKRSMLVSWILQNRIQVDLVNLLFCF